MNRYFNPVRTYLGYGALEKLPDIAEEAVIPGRKILLLAWDDSVFENPEIRKFIHEGRECAVTRVFRASNPELTQLFETYEETKEIDPGLVIAVGGGSVMDIGKSLCVLFGSSVASEEKLREMIAQKAYANPACRWIGIPTTAGTGSEVTRWATIWDSEHDRKYSIDTEQNFAYAAIVDPALAETMPMSLAVSSALDAVCHAAESYWAKAANTVSRALALEAIRIILDHIDLLISGEETKNDGDLKEAHEWMAKGSMLAGLAFSNTRTTACHSISYPLTMRHRIPHGVAVSLLLEPVFKLNLSAICDADALFYAFGARDVEEVGTRMRSLLQDAGYPVTLREWGVTEEELPDLAAHGMTPGRADNNPMPLSQDVVMDILKSVL